MILWVGLPTLIALGKKNLFFWTNSSPTQTHQLPSYSFHSNSLWGISGGEQIETWKRELGLTSNWLSFLLCSGLSLGHTLGEHNSHFLSATYLSFHVVLRLGDLFISPRHTALFLLWKAIRSKCRALDSFRLQGPSSWSEAAPSLMAPVWAGGQAFSCLGTQCFLRGKTPVMK